MLLEDYPRARWRDVLLGERHGNAAFHPTPVRSDAHLRGRTQCDDVLRHLHFDAMQSDARIGYCGAMYLERRLQTGWEFENRGCLPFFRRVPVATDSDCVECDDQQLAYQRGTIIHFPIRIRLDEGYGKLFHRPAAADAEIVSAVHAAADCDLAVSIEGQGSMLPVHTFQQYRAFTLRQETGLHRLMHNLAVGIDVGCEGRVAKSERHHADLGDTYRHAVRPMPNLPFKGYGKLCRLFDCNP